MVEWCELGTGFEYYSFEISLGKQMRGFMKSLNDGTSVLGITIHAVCCKTVRNGLYSCKMELSLRLGVLNSIS